jgi:endoglucanase
MTRKWIRATRVAALVALALTSIALVGAAGAASRPKRTTSIPKAHAAYAQQCADPYPAQRDPTNPLDLPVAPGADPLTGAQFFVDGPAHGSAAGEVAKLVGLNPKSFPNSYSWAQLQQQLGTGTIAQTLFKDPGLAYKVRMLSKIAAEPEVQRLSIYSMGGGPGAIFKQTQKLLCDNFTADPGSIGIFNTYFLHPALGGCSSTAEINAYGPVFRRRVDEMAQAIENRPAVLLLELDAIGSSKCMANKGSLPAWEADLKYEADAFGALPHTVVYIEGGYSDGNSPAYTAKALNASGVGDVRGFYTNDTHLNWTINEVNWANQVSAMTNGAHYIVNTSENGNGPLVPKNRVKHGNEDLCNPPGRGLGPLDTTQTGFPFADAFMWTHPPGNSSGCGGGPPGGVFWPTKAIGLASRANGRLGPGYPSAPYS